MPVLPVMNWTGNGMIWAVCAAVTKAGNHLLGLAAQVAKLAKIPENSRKFPKIPERKSIAFVRRADDDVPNEIKSSTAMRFAIIRNQANVVNSVSSRRYKGSARIGKDRQGSGKKGEDEGGDGDEDAAI